ncbi:hypothetical protein [Streptomyces palmae]|uniref:Uncharacterized protein n=1 Tax=Streptomyces palmae TaxID=1701085 RepID=A0A4Z0GIF2_9ACTN|nr:hypothetical protein [Streptomyces palmae]TGA95271.1 hypothetical protein E4099_25675 [Streptomyces palmae]
MVALVLLVLIAGGAVAWSLLRGHEDSPLGDRPRATDRAAGISYAVPEGWKYEDKGLVDAFTSTLGGKGRDGTGAGMVVGRGGGIPESALRQRTEAAARSNAEYFYGDCSWKQLESRATTVDDRPAHTVLLKVRDEDGPAGRLRMTVISLPGDRAAFLIGFSGPGDAAEGRLVDLVLESVAVES